jgi:hypothetical protein
MAIRPGLLPLIPTLALALAVVPALVAADAAPHLSATASSFQPGQNNEPQNAVDGDTKSFWHSAWKPDQLPVTLTIDQGVATTIAAMIYLPRPGGGNGTITSYNLFGSTDGTTWTKIVDKGSFDPGAKRKAVNFDPVSARYVKLEVLAGVGGFASAAEVSFSPKPVDTSIPPTPPVQGQISVISPKYCAEIKGTTKIQVLAPGLTSATVTCWKEGQGEGADATVGSITFDADGKGSIDFPADDFQHGPLCVILTGSPATILDGSMDKKMVGGKEVQTPHIKPDHCCLQLYNQGGLPGFEGLPKAPAQTDGMKEIFADDFDKMPTISSNDNKSTYYDHKPPDGSQDFSGPMRFTGFNDAGNPFYQTGSWLRIRADENLGTAGLIAPRKKDGSGILVHAPCYFECRFIGPNAPGTWPAFWLLTDLTDGTCDELDILEAYGGEAKGSPSAFDCYCVTPHAWGQGKDQTPREQTALKEEAACKGNAHFSWAPQVVKMGNIGIPSTWYQAPHVYGCKITDTDTTYYCDDLVIAHHATMPVSKTAPFYFLVNLATSGGWPVDLSRYNGLADMYVDYVRVYSGNQADIDKYKK